MKELTGRNEKFFINWEERRKKKWQYVLLHGCVYWGFSVAITTFIIHSNFKPEEMKLSDLIARILIFGIGGMIVGLSIYNQRDKVYLNRDKAEILEGIKMLKEGKVWKYENLKIKKENDETINVRYELFCSDKSNVITEQLNNCYDKIIGDFQKISENIEFKEFSKNYNVKIQIFEVLDNQTPLLEKEV